MKGGVKIREVDHGALALLKRVLTLRIDSPLSVAVGILAGDDKEYAGGQSIEEIATYMEFGTDNIPPRSFIRDTFDLNRDAVRERLRILFGKMIKGKLTERAAMEQFGAWAVGLVQKRISDGIPPPNADSTVRQKGSDKPLIDTGVLRSSITYEVRSDK